MLKAKNTPLGRGSWSPENIAITMDALINQKMLLSRVRAIMRMPIRLPTATPLITEKRWEQLAPAQW